MADELRKGPSGPPVALDSDSIANESSVPGATVTNALDNLTGAIPASGTEPGYLERHIYVNASSTRLNSSFMGVIIEAVTNFTDPSQLPPGNLFHLGLASAGASGTSGGRGTASNSPWSTGGGGGGAFFDIWLSRSDLVALIAAGNAAMSAPLGGTPVIGDSSSATSTTNNLAGNNPSGPTTFGPFAVFPGGGANINTISAARAGGPGGGWQSQGLGGITSGTDSLGGNPLGGCTTPTGGSTLGTTSLYGGAGCLASLTTTARAGQSSVWGGASGGVAAHAANATANGGNSLRGAAGGGSGSGSNNASVGGTAGTGGSTGNGLALGGAGGAPASGAGTRVGGNGAPGADSPNVWLCCGAGGGGGACGNSTNGAATGGNGGAGGFPGGGSGGGGTGAAQTAGQVSTGGSSGPGGDSLIILESFL